MYQARQLIGSDASGLSDPFARIAFVEQSVCTQVIEQTLSPTWDEMLIIKEVDIYGLMEEIVDDPPTIIVEIFDQDKVVRTVVHNSFKLVLTSIRTEQGLKGRKGRREG